MSNKGFKMLNSDVIKWMMMKMKVRDRDTDRGECLCDLTSLISGLLGEQRVYFHNMLQIIC